MKALRRLASVLCLVTVFTVSVVFVRFNSESTSIFFGNFKILESPLSVLVLGSFVIGSVLGLLCGLRFLSFFKMKAEIKHLKKMKLQ